MEEDVGAASRMFIISNLERFSKETENGYGKLFGEIGAKLVERLGSSNEAVYPCFEAASHISFVIDRRAPGIYPRTEDNGCLEHPDFRHFQDLVRDLLPLTEHIRDFEHGYIQWHAEQGTEASNKTDLFLEISKERVRTLDALVDILAAHRPSPPERKKDPRSRWHSMARYIASCIEDAFQRAGIECPSRSSALSPLVLAVQDVLKVVGYTQEPDAIRKVLGKSR